MRSCLVHTKWIFRGLGETRKNSTVASKSNSAGSTLNKFTKGQMMQNAFLSRAGLVTGILGLFVATGLSPIAALGQTNDTGSSDSTASVTVEAECKWFLYNVSNSIILTPTGSSNYSGQALTLQGTATDITIRKSGSDQGVDSFSDCSFFGAKTNPTIYAEVVGTTFDATYGEANTEDIGMDFSIATDGLSGFKVDAGECTSNTDVWNEDVNDNTHYFLTESFTDSPMLSFTSNADVNNSLTSEADTQECQSDFAYEVTIPADLTPSQPGESYSYTGPSVKITAMYTG